MKNGQSRSQARGGTGKNSGQACSAATPEGRRKCPPRRIADGARAPSPGPLASIAEPRVAAEGRPCRAGSGYFSSTPAPASSSSAFSFSASSLAMPSLTAPGAPSTRSFASLRPRPGRRADDLDHLDLLVAGAGEDDVEGVLLLRRRRAVAAGGGCARGRDRDRSGGGDAPLLLDRLLELDELEHGHLAERLEHLRGVRCHLYSSSVPVSAFSASAAARPPRMPRVSSSVASAAASSAGERPPPARPPRALPRRRLRTSAAASAGASSAAASSAGASSAAGAAEADVSPPSSSCVMRASMQADEVAERSRDQRGELGERRDDHADELRLHDLRCRELCELLDVGAGQRLPGEDAAAEREHLRVLRCVGERLRDGDGIAVRLDERDRRRALEQGEQRLGARPPRPHDG